MSNITRRTLLKAAGIAGAAGVVSTGFSSSQSASACVRAAQFTGARPDGAALSDWNDMNTTIGPSDTTRIFYPDALPVTFTDTSQIESQLPAGVIPIVSYKTQTTNVASYVQSVTRPLWLIFHHEPEGGTANGDFSSGAEFVSQFTQQSQLIRAQGNPNVKVVMCAGAYQYRPGGNGADGSYLPSPGDLDYYTVDVYQNPTSKSTWPSGGLSNYPRFQSWLALVQGRGVPVGITEYGVYSDNSQIMNTGRNDRIKQDCAYIRTLSGWLLWEYWWMGVWKFTDPAAVTTWKEIVAGTL